MVIEQGRAWVLQTTEAGFHLLVPAPVSAIAQANIELAQQLPKPGEGVLKDAKATEVTYPKSPLVDDPDESDDETEWSIGWGAVVNEATEDAYAGMRSFLLALEYPRNVWAYTGGGKTQNAGYL